MNLIIRQGQEAGRRIRLERGLVTIGRGQDNSLVVLETQASRHHAELRRYGEQWLIVDVGSANGTFVGGVRLAVNEPRRLMTGVPVAIGETTLVLEEAADAPPEPSPEIPPELEARLVAAARPAARPVAAAWHVAAWLARGLAAAGGAALIAGSLADWLRVEVTVPLLGRVIDRVVHGLDGGLGVLLLAVGVAVLASVAIDVLPAKSWGLVAGMIQALVGAGAALAAALSVYLYFRADQASILGISLLDVFEFVQPAVHLTMRAGLWLMVVGLGGVIGGGLLRLVVAGLQPAAGARRGG